MDSDWKSISAMASGTRGFLKLADTAPNVGAKSEEERRERNE
jgi:hypothetical protein